MTLPQMELGSNFVSTTTGMTKQKDSSQVNGDTGEEW